jgi:tRNA (uracil-5-)-methyltransferase TRM9
MAVKIKEFSKENFIISKSNDIKIKIISKKEYEKENKLPNQEKIWDNISELWQDFRIKSIPIVEEFLSKVSLERKSEKIRILDLGCGSGRNMIENKNIEYYEVDFSEKQLDAAKKKAREEKINAKFFKIKADKLLFEDNYFDYGLFIATIHCIETEKQRKNSLKEFYRVLKKGAEALISVWDSEDKRFKGKGREVYMEWKVNNIPHMRYYYLYDKEELVNLLKSNGFKILEIYNPRKKDRFSRKNIIMRIRKQ